MRLAWSGNYKFEKGDVVRVRKGHPWAWRVGIVEIAYSNEQFGVTLMPTRLFLPRECTFWAKSLEVVSSGRNN